MRRPRMDVRPLLIGLSLISLLFLVLCLLSRDVGRYSVSLATPVFAGISFYYLKKMPFSAVQRRAVLFVTATVAVLYTALILFSGLHFGFFLADVPISFKSLLSYILPITVTVVSTEIIRGAFLGQKGSIPWLLAFLIGILTEVLLVATFSSVRSFSHFMDLVGMAILPALAAQPLYQYTGKHFGTLPAIVYRLVTALSPYLLPIKSGIPDSLCSFISILVPPMLLFLLRLLYGKSVKSREDKRTGKWRYAVIVAALLLSVSFVALISNEFRYGLLVIATESMTGEINKGDAVIYEEYTDQFVDEHDIIVFYLDGRVTVHRVIDIAYVNGQKRYFTKGDANEDPDPGYALDEQIVGIVRAKLPYFGYPTLSLRGMFQ